MKYVSAPTLFGATIQLLPHVARRPLIELDEAEQGAAVKAAAKLAKLVANEFAKGSWGPTIEPLPKNDSDKIPKSASGKPEWIRLPTKDRCPHTGLSRSSLYDLVCPTVANDHRPPVKSILIRKRGAARGIRLISYDSLMHYLSEEARNQTNGCCTGVSAYEGEPSAFSDSGQHCVTFSSCGKMKSRD